MIITISLMYQRLKAIILIKIFCNMMDFVKIYIITFVIVLYDYIKLYKIYKRSGIRCYYWVYVILYINNDGRIVSGNVVLDVSESPRARLFNGFVGVFGS